MPLSDSNVRFATTPVWWRTFSDENSALMLVCAWLLHVAGTRWGDKKYMNMKHLEVTPENL